MDDLVGLCTAYRAQLLEKSSSIVASLAERSRSIGAICESSQWLASRLFGAITNGGTNRIVELGAGFGSVTRLLPETAVSIERDKQRYDHLRSSFPNRAILDCCAINFLPSLDAPSVVLSSIPSVNNPEFRRLRAAVALGRKRGSIVELVTYTYFPHNPFEDIFPFEERTGLEFRNIPPAFVWRYRS